MTTLMTTHLGLQKPHLRANNGNPIMMLNNMIHYSDFSKNSKMTFSSGNDISHISPAKGTVDFVENEPSPMVYDATLFNGRGGMKTTDSESDISYDNAVGSGSPVTTTLGLVAKLPTYSANRSVIAIGTTFSGSSLARIMHIGAGRIGYARDTGLFIPQIFNTGQDNIFICFLNFTSSTNLDILALDSSGTEHTLSLTPDLGYQAPIVWLGDRGVNDGEAGLEYAEFFQTSTALTANQIERIKQFWKTRYL